MIEKRSGSRDRGASYVITADALRFFGVTEQDQLPQYKEFLNK